MCRLSKDNFLARTYKKLILFCFILISAQSAFSHTVTLKGGIDLFAYDPTALTNSNRAFVFTPIGINGTSLTGITVEFSVEGEFTTFAGYYLKVEADALLSYMLRAGASFNLWIFKFGIGTFLSFMNIDGDSYIPGVIGSIGLEFPGGIMLDVEFGANVFSTLLRAQSTNVYFGKAKLAVWLPIVVIGGFMERKGYAQSPGTTYSITDSLLRYGGLLTFFGKDFPLTIGFIGGLETLTRSISPYPPPIPSNNTERFVDAYFAGLNLSIQLSKSAEFLLGGEYPFPSNSAVFFFSGYAGFRFTLPEIR